MTQLFWVHDIRELWNSWDIIPTMSQSISIQYNSLTRMAICIFIFLLIFESKQSHSFITLSLLFIIFVYYIQKLMMNHNNKKYKKQQNKEQYKEQYINTRVPESVNTKPYKRYNHPVGELVMGYEPSFYDPNPKKMDFNDKDTPTINQRFAGKANPKTLINPIIVPPAMDLDYWRTTNMVTHSQINDQVHQDDHLSGYYVEDDGYTDKYSGVENFQNNDVYKYTGELPKLKSSPLDIKQADSSKQHLYVDTYDRCHNQDSVREYNSNIRRNIIQPGIYTTSKVDEPIQSNIGISYAQQFPEESVSRHNSCKTSSNTPVESNVFDPRFYGYGTSYRSYVEPVTGQPRFMYDDINAVKMPNYVARSKIDHLQEASKYETLSDFNRYGNPNTRNIRHIAQDAWLTNTNNFREDLSKSLMRKRNGEMQQLRAMPHGAKFR